LRSPVTGLRLVAERLEEGGAELSLFAGRDPDLEIVGIAVARLQAALGPHVARRATVTSGNRYEARVAYEDFDIATVVRSPRVCSALVAEPPARVDARRDETATLAYRVLVPRAVEVRIKSGRPVFVGTRAVLDVAGPWRVDEAWWAEALDTGGLPIAHDAYDVLLDDGSLCRIRQRTRRLVSLRHVRLGGCEPLQTHRRQRRRLKAAAGPPCSGQFRLSI